MPQNARPLSPHLQIYRWSLAMALSILHRATGIALAVGLLLVLWFLLCLAQGEKTYAVARAFCGSWLGTILLFGWSWALFLHLCNGVRHLFWDAGRGFGKAQAYRNGVVVIVASLVLTALVWACVLTGGGAA